MEPKITINFSGKWHKSSAQFTKNWPHFTKRKTTRSNVSFLNLQIPQQNLLLSAVIGMKTSSFYIIWLSRSELFAVTEWQQFKHYLQYTKITAYLQHTKTEKLALESSQKICIYFPNNWCSKQDPLSLTLDWKYWFIISATL